jgi:hypothetical protein
MHGPHLIDDGRRHAAPAGVRRAEGAASGAGRCYFAVITAVSCVL